MTIVSTNTVEQYVGDGVQTEWPVPFPFLRPEDVRAVVSGTGGDRVLDHGTDYTAVALPGGGGRVVTTPGGPGMAGSGERLTLWLEQPFTQEMDLRNTGVLDAEMLERGFDRLTLMAQQLREEVGRCVKVPLTDQTTRTDALLEGITANVGRAELAALGAETHAAAASSGAVRAESAASAVDAALVGVSVLRGEVTQAVADARDAIVASAAFVPIGAILDFPVNTVPVGFLVCAGQTVAKEAYPELVAYLTGDPLALSATLPDYRGEFRRGADLGRGVDAGRAVGSAQEDAFQGHWHELWRYGGDVFGGGSSPGISSGANTNTKIGDGLVRTATADGANGTPRVASETRPRNVAVVSCIKAYHAPMSAEPVDMSGVLVRLNTIETSGAEAKQPQTIMRCRMKAPMAPPFSDMPMPGFLSFSGLTVTLLADPTNPFVACFGGGGVNVVGRAEGNLPVTLPNVPTTHWLYVARNPDTGVLALGATDIPPEYNTVRCGVDAMPAFTADTLAGWGTVTVDSTYTSNYGWKALNKGPLDGSNKWQSAGAAAWLRLVLTKTRRVRGVRISCADDAGMAPKAFTIKVGSGATPDVVAHTQTTQTGWSAAETREFLFDVPQDLQSLEVNITANNGSSWTNIGELTLLFVEDWYSPAENIMRKADGTQVQRVYVGKAVVSGGVVTAVIPFHPGVFAFIPGNGGNKTLASTWIYEHNPFGMPVTVSPPEMYSTDAQPWQRQMDYFNNSGNGDGVWLYEYDNAVIRWQCIGSQRLGKYRIPVRRAF